MPYPLRGLFALEFILLSRSEEGEPLSAPVHGDFCYIGIYPASRAWFLSYEVVRVARLSRLVITPREKRSTFGVSHGA